MRVPVPELALERQLRLVLRREGDLSHAVQAFLAVAEHHATETGGAYSFASE